MDKTIEIVKELKTLPVFTARTWCDVAYEADLFESRARNLIQKKSIKPQVQAFAERKLEEVAEARRRLQALKVALEANK